MGKREGSASKLKNGLFLAAGGCLAAAGLWLALATPPERIPRGWSWKSSFVGTFTSPDPETGAFPQQNVLGIYDREITIHSERDRPQWVVLKDDFIIRDAITGAVTWRYTVFPKINPRTGQHLELAHRDQFIVFPHNVERRPYKLRMNYLEGVTLTFLKDDSINGVPVYLFGYKGQAEYTESYIGTADYPGVSVLSGQEIRCADNQFTFMIWVEPLTGEAVKLVERCESGDYIFNISTGAPVGAVARWGGETAGRDVLRSTDWIRDERLSLLAAKYMPYGLACFGIVMAGAGLARRRARA